MSALSALLAAASCAWASVIYSALATIALYFAIFRLSETSFSMFSQYAFCGILLGAEITFFT